MRSVLEGFLFVLLAAASVATTAATITVTNTNDTGAGSLRNAVAAAASGDTINFSVSGTINLTGGAIDIDKSLTITGPGAASLAIRGNNQATYLFRVVANNTVSISGLTLYDAYNAIDAPGNLTLSNAIVRDNVGSIGAGITACYGDNSLIVIDTTFQDNVADNGGGAIAACGTLSISGSTFSGNTAGTGDATGYGGAIAIGSTTSATIVNSTFSDNTAAGDGSSGGAIYTNYDTLTITNSTLAGNTAANGSNLYIGGIETAATVNLRNTLIAGGIGGSNCNTSITGENVANLDHGGPAPLNSCGAGNTGNPVLGPLAFNGGPTQTMAIGAGGAAINAGNNSVCPATDQREVSRPQFVICDVGAYESTEPPFVPSISVPVPTLGEWALLALASLLGLLGMRRTRAAR